MALASPESKLVIPLAKTITYSATNRERNPHQWAIRRARLYRALAVIPPIIILIVWELCASLGLIDVRFFPAPSSIGQNAWDLIVTGELVGHLAATTNRLLIGFPIGAILGAVTGTLIGSIPFVQAMFRPSISALYTIPKLGIYPLLLLIFGLDDTPKILLVVWASFLVVTISAIDAASSVAQAHLDAGRAFNASRWRQFVEIILPSVLPQLFTAFRLAVGMGILVIIATEFVNSTSGVGYLIWNSWQLFQPGEMYVGIVASAVMGYLATLLVDLLGRLAMPWNPKRMGSSVGV